MARIIELLAVHLGIFGGSDDEEEDEVLHESLVADSRRASEGLSTSAVGQSYGDEFTVK